MFLSSPRDFAGTPRQHIADPYLDTEVIMVAQPEPGVESIGRRRRLLRRFRYGFTAFRRRHGGSIRLGRAGVPERALSRPHPPLTASREASGSDTGDSPVEVNPDGDDRWSPALAQAAPGGPARRRPPRLESNPCRTRKQPPPRMPR